MGLRTVGVRLAAEVTGYRNQLRAAATATREFTAELDQAARAGKLDKVADAAGRMGLGLTAAFGAAVAMTARFDKQMSEVGAVSGATAEQMGKLRQAALDAGKATSFSASEAAQAEAELAKAGISTADILGGALAGSLNLAAAGTLDLAEAADISAKTMNIFKLSGQDVGHIADVLAAAANKSATDVHEMGEALKQGGLAAQASGMGLEETAGTLAAFADNALNGSDAGTSLKTALMMLQAPTGKAADTMKELGINAYDAQGNFIGTARLAGVLEKALGGLTQEQRNAALATIFGADGMRAANVLYGLGEKGVREYIAAVDDQGAAAETAKKKTDNLAGDVERLTGSLETLAIQAGSGANGGLRTLVKTADGLVGAFSDLPGPVQSTLTVLAGVGGTGLLAVAGLLKVKSTAGDAMQALRDVGPAGERAAAGIGRIGKVAGTLSLASLGVLAVFEGMKAFGAWVEKKHAPVKADIDKLTTSIKEFADTGDVVGELASKYGSSLQKIGADVDGITKGMADLAQTRADIESGLSAPEVGVGWDPVDPQALQRIKDMDQTLTAMVQAGGASQAKIFLDQLRSSGALTGDQFARLMTMLPGYNQAATAAAQANTGLAAGFGSIGANAQTMNGSLTEAIEKGQTLLDVWKQLNGATLSFDEAQLRAKDAIDGVKKSFEENGKAIEGNSRAAIENRVKVGEAAEAAATAAQRKYEETGSVSAATAVYDDYIAGLKTTLHNANLTDAQIATLIATYAQMPPEVTTEVTANTAPATAAAKALVARINEMTARVDVYAVTHGIPSFGGGAHTGVGYSTGQRWGGVWEPAETGLLREASRFSARNPGRFMIAEPATGGELFAPKYGDLAKTRREVGYAIENWWGGWKAFAPPMAAPAPVSVPAPAPVNPVAQAAAIRAALIGVSVQLDGRTVGYIQGRQADILSR